MQKISNKLIYSLKFLKNVNKFQFSSFAPVNDWFQSIKIGDIECSNRIFLAPMTRCRTDPQTSIPNQLMVDYYSQRASFGLIFTECSPVSVRGNCFPGCGGIFTKEQAEGWKQVVKAVHAKGGKIVLQIWHCGRTNHPILNGIKDVWAPSSIGLQQQHPILKQNFPVPIAMTKENIKQVLKEFRQGAELAMQAGFDGLQLHGANGYLVDQFLKSYTNQRTDEYGGSAENRCRFALEVMDELISVYGKERVGIRISPTGRYNEMYDSNPVETYSYLLKKLDQRQIASVEIRESSSYDVSFKEGIPSGAEQLSDVASTLRPYFQGVLINNTNFNPQSGLERMKQGIAQAITFGVLGLAHPDLPNRIKNNYPLTNKPDFKTFFVGGPKGYIDYPVYQK